MVVLAGENAEHQEVSLNTKTIAPLRFESQSNFSNNLNQAAIAALSPE